MHIFLDKLISPIGEIFLAWNDGALRALDFEDCETRLERLLQAQYPHHQLFPMRAPSEIRDPLEAYFAGDIAALVRVPTQSGGTPFQREVWSALREIPAGQTTTYGALAARIGRPSASRAVGLANGSNPIAVVVPCHRVIGANGALVGYAGGVERKRWLLTHERAIAPLDTKSARSVAPRQPEFAF